MKALLLNGSPHEKGCTYTALAEVEKTLQARGIETEMLWLGKRPIQGCVACGSCAKTGRCAFDDEVNRLIDRLDDFDAIVIGSPVYYSAPNGQLIAFLNRLFYAGGRKMAHKVAASVVSCRRGGSTATFEQLNQYFGISNMVVATSKYWNQVHGARPEDVLRDEEGLQTMRSLGENIAWLLKTIEAGKNAGIEPPTYEPKLRTNFIR